MRSKMRLLPTILILPIVILLAGLVIGLFPPVSSVQAQNAVWRPRPGASFQWQLTGQPIDITVSASAYIIDLYANDPTVVKSLQAAGRKVICYVNLGVWEDFLPDKDGFPKDTLGKPWNGSSNARWLDIRKFEDFTPALRARLDLCKQKGFDAVGPDNIDAYKNDSGFALTADDQLRFNRFLATEAHARGLSIGLHNDADQADDLGPWFDWALTEDCFAQGWCEKMEPFTKSGKAVFMTEYKERVDLQKFQLEACTLAKKLRFTALLKPQDLSASRNTCI
jgi:Glycoside-hydrolase family GH114